MTATTHHASILGPGGTVPVVHDVLEDLPELFFIHADAGAAAVASGAHTVLILEQTTGMNLAETIHQGGNQIRS
jgi:hypothetical protein